MNGISRPQPVTDESLPVALVDPTVTGAQGMEGEGSRLRHHRRTRHLRARQEGRCNQHLRQPPRRRRAQQGGPQGPQRLGIASSPAV